MTRGIECLNPMNIMTYPNITWQGEKKPTIDPENRLCTFLTIEDGIRAGSINLLSYYLQDECSTIRDIITRYAPASENPTSNYISFVASFCDVGPDDTVVLTNQSFLEKLVSAIIREEQGFDACTDEQIANGVSLALNYKKVNLS